MSVHQLLYTLGSFAFLTDISPNAFHVNAVRSNSVHVTAILAMHDAVLAAHFK